MGGLARVFSHSSCHLLASSSSCLAGREACRPAAQAGQAASGQARRPSLTGRGDPRAGHLSLYMCAPRAPRLKSPGSRDFETVVCRGQAGRPQLAPRWAASPPLTEGRGQHGVCAPARNGAAGARRRRVKRLLVSAVLPVARAAALLRLPVGAAAAPRAAPDLRSATCTVA